MRLTILCYICVIAELGITLNVSLNEQVIGLKNLVRKLPNHVFPTCHLVLVADLANFTSAENRCKRLPAMLSRTKKAGTLATVNSREANDFLTLLFNAALPKHKQHRNTFAGTRWVWTGLRKTKKINQKHIRKVENRKPYNAEDWQWYDGSTPKDFENWNRGQPDQRPLKMGKKSSDYKHSGICKERLCRQNQMRLNHEGMWDDAFSFEEHPFACDYQGKYIVSAEMKTWEEAKAACEAAGLQLATVRNLEETDQLRRALIFFLGESGFDNCKGAFGNGKDYEHGVGQSNCVKVKRKKRWDPIHWAWTGGNDLKKEGDYRWTDGTVVLFEGFPWIANAGDNNGSKRKAKGQNSLTISKWGEFDDSYGHDKKPFACECYR